MRLIDADALANDLLYDIEMDANALDNTDLVGIERERIQFDKDCKQNCVYYLTETEPIDAVKVVRCRDCKHSEHWYSDRSRCFLWAESGIAVFDDGFCNYAERKEK